MIGTAGTSLTFNDKAIGSNRGAKSRRIESCLNFVANSSPDSAPAALTKISKSESSSQRSNSTDLESLRLPPTPRDLILEDNLCGNEIGEKLIQFFREGQKAPYDDDFVFRWPVKGSPIHTIKASMMKRVTIACSRAFHCLVRSHDWSFLQTNAIARDLAETTTVIQIPLTSILANHLLKASRWHTMELENASKATVRISALDSRS
jgi:hypothetical protein